MDDKDLERQLVAYLSESKKERGSMFDQLKGVGNATQRILHQLELHQQKDDLSFAALTDNLKGLSSRIAALEVDIDDTGTHNIAQLQRELDDRKKAQQGLMHVYVNAGIGAAIALVGGLLAIVVTYIFRSK